MESLTGKDMESKSSMAIRKRIVPSKCPDRVRSQRKNCFFALPLAVIGNDLKERNFTRNGNIFSERLILLKFREMVEVFVV